MPLNHVVNSRHSFLIGSIKTYTDLGILLYSQVSLFMHNGLTEKKFNLIFNFPLPRIYFSGIITLRNGRVAQRERKCLTSIRSGVQIPPRPPVTFYIYISHKGASGAAGAQVPYKH